MQKTLVERLLAGHGVAAANINPAVTALMALPAGATQAQISACLQAPPISITPATNADVIARDIIVHHATHDAARDGLVVEDPANKFVRTSDIDLTDVVRQPGLLAALNGHNVAINDPANPLLTQQDGRRFLTVAHGDEFSRSLGRARGLGWVALIVALLLLALGLWKNSDVDDRLAGHDGRLSTLAASDAATLTALTKLAGDQTGMATQIADHESRIGTIETNDAKQDGLISAAQAKAEAAARRADRLQKVSIATCVAAGGTEEECRANLKAGKSLYTRPAAPAPVSAAALTPPQAGSLNVIGDALVVTLD